MKFLLENVPLSIKNLFHDLGFDVFTLYDYNILGIQNGEVAQLALKEKAIIITLDHDFLQFNKSKSYKRRIRTEYIRL
ncbi:MAG: DUF5615 family PIN-like protein [Promethearchaeota archaeon]